MEIVYVYQRKRKEFGKHPVFSDRPASVSTVIPQDAAYIKNYVERNPCHVEIQTAADKSEHEVSFTREFKSVGEYGECFIFQ